MPGNYLGGANCYVIKGYARNLLIDTGMDTKRSRAELLYALDELGLKGENTDVFLTHFHPDHIGNAAFLEKLGYTLYMSSVDYRHFSYNIRNNMIPDLAMARTEGFPSSKLQTLRDILSKKENTTEMFGVEEIEADRVFSYGEYNFKAVLTIGHSPGHMCLYDERKRIFISGDHFLFGTFPYVSASLYIADPLKEYIRSMYVIKSLDIELLLPGHGKGVGDYKARADEIVRHHKERNGKILELLEAHPKSTAYELASEMSLQLKGNGGWNRLPIVKKFGAAHGVAANLTYLTNKKLLLEKETDGCLHYNIRH